MARVLGERRPASVEDVASAEDFDLEPLVIVEDAVVVDVVVVAAAVLTGPPAQIT